MLLYPIGGDVLTHLVMIDCFSTQFWQGDIIPRWCFNANSEFGAPIFLFYFPLSYYVTALLHPFGLSLYSTLVLGCFLATLVTALTCFTWLKDIVPPRYALLGAALFLFMPYRAEVMFHRLAYTELWQIAWLPLLCLYGRRLALGNPRAILPLACAIGLSLLSHVPCTVIGVMLIGVYMLATAPAWKPMGHYVLAVTGGLVLAAFYLIPALYYSAFIHTDLINDPKWAWPNLFPTLANIEYFHLGRAAVVMALTIAVLACFELFVWRRRGGIEDTFVRREIAAWSIVTGVALILLLPLSEPLYSLFGPLKNIVFPWRMQIAFALGMTYMLAVWMRWLLAQERLYGNLCVLAALLLIVPYLLLNYYDERNAALFKDTLEARHNIAPEYRTRWTDDVHYSRDAMVKRHTLKEQIPWVTAVSGKGTAEVTQWAWNGIVLHIKTIGPLTLRLDHTYFPIWRARTEQGDILPLGPEEKTGRMLLKVPAGEQNVTLTYATHHGHAALGLSLWLSVAAWLGAAVVFRKRQQAT